MDEANRLAYLALILVIPASIVAFQRLPATHAVLGIWLGSMMFLPERVVLDAPLLPPFDKHSIPALCLLVGAFVKAGDKVRLARPGRGMDLLIIGAVLAAFGTVMTNRDALRYGPTKIPGLELGDVVSYASEIVLGQGAAFFLGRTLFRSSADARDLLRALAIGGVIYAPFVLVELRMSPQWHNWIYGFMQHDFSQTYRSGAWRPMVFMSHGLALALFLCASAYSAWQLSRARSRIFRFSAKSVAIGLTVLLALVNSFGALIYGIVAVIMSWFLRPRTQLIVALVCVSAIALYPWLRASGVFPAQDLVDLAARVSQDRAGSLAFRFRNEDELLLRALERPYFGWGGWGRNFVFTPQGQTFSVVDGGWIAYVGAWGFVGSACRFGLLLLPVPIALFRLGRVAPADRPLLAGVALAATFYALDLLPNGMFNHLPSLLSGALLGLATGMPGEIAKPRIDRAMLLRYVTALRRSAAAATTRGLTSQSVERPWNTE